MLPLKSLSAVSSASTQSWFKDLAYKFVIQLMEDDSMSELETASWLRHELTVRTQPEHINYSCLCLSSLAIRQPSCFLRLAWQLSTGRILQLAELTIRGFSNSCAWTKLLCEVYAT
ncbi:hypothetical protein CSKR_105886 [Clonorchis sinensis]|uniref:Uncharacterized protein n=1 Tax=Clonorchis sinensis TaxID=79923 RepID=A0A419QHH8_CLOSI|nr:hypothetical protein CSKR_105886 [Clonorchis sinensis]